MMRKLEYIGKGFPRMYKGKLRAMAFRVEFPPELLERVREKAFHSRESLNNTIVTLIRKALART